MKNIVRILFLVIWAGQLLAQTSFQVDCPVNPQTFGDYTPNDLNLWNEPYWHDLQNNIQNMPEGPTDLKIVFTDTCADVRVRYLLYLDLDQNGTLETLVDSDSLPGYNNVLFGNILNPGNGIPRAFDERLVDSTEKYGFALQTTTDGNNTTANLRWHTQLAPETYKIPELPYGQHKIKWIISDACGNESSCEYNFIVKDVKPPVFVCSNGLSASIAFPGQVQIFTPNLLVYAEDNATPDSLLRFSAVKSAEGMGVFPLNSLGNPVSSLIFDCSEVGVQTLQLWSMDLAGNTDFCETYVIIQDNNSVCSNQAQEIITCINFWKDGSPMQVELNYESSNPLTIVSSAYDSLGCAVAMLNAATPTDITVTPVLNTDPLNGVNALDLIRISQHILGLKPLGTYAQIAADINKSGSITAFDIVELKKLLVGIYATLPNNNSWRFVGTQFMFPNPNNPFGPFFPEIDSLTVLPDSSLYSAFIGVKIGDLDGSAYPGFGAPNEDRTTAIMTLPDATLLAGETIELPLRMQTEGDWLGLQMGLHFDPQLLEVEIQNIDNLPGWDATSWAMPQPGLLNLAWFNTQPAHWRNDQNVLTLRVRALAPVQLQNAIRFSKKDGEPGTAAAAVTADGELQSLHLAFDKTTISGDITTIFSPQPNPTRSDVQIPIRLAQEEMVTLQLTDLTGRMLFQNRVAYAAGTHLLNLPATAFPENGLYLWRVQAGATVAEGKVVKM